MAQLKEQTFSSWLPAGLCHCRSAARWAGRFCLAMWHFKIAICLQETDLSPRTIFLFSFGSECEPSINQECFICSGDGDRCPGLLGCWQISSCASKKEWGRSPKTCLYLSSSSPPLYKWTRQILPFKINVFKNIALYTDVLKTSTEAYHQI